MQAVSDLSFKLLIKFLERYFHMDNHFKNGLKPMLFEVNYQKGIRLLNFRQRQDHLWFLWKGLVREVHVDEESLQEHTSWFWREGSLICADPGFFSQEPAEKTIEVLEDCRLICFSYKDWLLLKRDFVEVEKETEKLRSLYARRRQRFSEELLHRSAIERYLNHREELEHLCMRTKVKYVAEYMGMSADTLTRLKKLHLG